MSADYSLEMAIRDRLVTTAAVLALVPAAHILYRQNRKPSPSIVCGEGQTMPLGSDTYGISRVQIMQTLHIWKEEPTLHGVKQIMGAINEALRGGALPMSGPWYFSSLDILSMRSLYDPDGKTSHGVFSLRAAMSRASP